MNEMPEVAEALKDVFINEDGRNVVDALYLIARGLDRIGAALDGPWPAVLAENLERCGIGTTEASI